MCFTKYVDKVVDPSIATEDITCYKTVKLVTKGVYESIVYPFRYEEGKLYKDALIVERNFNMLIVEKAFHSFKYSIYAENCAAGLLEAQEPYPICAVACVIPKGAKYLENNYEFVSDQLIIITNKILRND